jgi:lipoate-protein ligase A
VRRAPKVIAFSRKDERQPGFAEARSAAKAHGFGVAVRAVGGSFAPLHEGSLIVDEYGFADGRGSETMARFARHADILRRVFVSYGVDARLGALEHEYCPGAFSVNARGAAKISGTAQRVSRDAWVVSSVIQVAATGPLNAVTESCARVLGQPVDVATIGSLAGEGVSLSCGEVARRVAATFREEGLIGRGGVLGVAI